MKTKYQILCLALLIFLMYGFVGHLEYQQELRAEAWAKSEQALQAQQEKLELDILEAKAELAKADKTLHEHHILIWDIRNSLHLDLEAELEEEK